MRQTGRGARHAKSGKGQGIALVEVLLSGFIMTTGILAELSMQTMALARAQTNSHLLQAEWLLSDMLERMKANRSGFVISLQVLPRGLVKAQCETVSGCSPAELAAHDLARWYHRVATLLPTGNVEIRPVTVAGYPESARTYQVFVRWQTDQDTWAMPVSSGIVVL